MWKGDWREQVRSQFDTHFDIIVIGGGITGAGILREAARLGYKVLLVEANDFASGTSSRSSKLVHGGLRYLKNLQLKTTLESVTERQNLLKHGKGLINHLDIVFASYQGDHTPAWQMGLGLVIYGIMAGKWQYSRLSSAEAQKIIPVLNTDQLVAGFPYYDAQTDDARLTLRVLQEGIHSGGLAINYTKVVSLLRNQHGLVQGVGVIDQTPELEGNESEITADLIINATGAWADHIREKIERPKRLRPLRGSHLVFQQNKLPLPCSVSINHPKDGRPVFAFPWEGVTVVGTTDIDTYGEVPNNPKISEEEAEYLLDFVQFAFPNQELAFDDVLSTWAGIRPVINTGKDNPSKESREHAIWFEDGLLSVTGGKLTTFRVMAWDVMKNAIKHLDNKKFSPSSLPILSRPKLNGSAYDIEISEAVLNRLIGRYGDYTEDILNNGTKTTPEFIPETQTIWRELEWTAENEGIIHLEDLLLRRTRIGFLLPDGGRNLLPEIRAKIGDKMPWSDERWQNEIEMYTSLIDIAYSLP
jgi:glycerol-3-phosphate dehydrogenase